MHQFSVITPTYNRANYLIKVHDCLCNQGDIDLEWVIIDDGSTDDTKKTVLELGNKIPIQYVYQENGGQVSAWNTGLQYTNSHITLKMDDDDILLPNVLEKVWSYFDLNTDRFEHGCVGLSGLCRYENGNIIGKKFPRDYFISDYIRYIKNKKIIGDKCDFFVTSISKMYPFPIMPGEKNIAPSIIYLRISQNYKTIYINELFQEKKFLLGGLSSINYWILYPQGSELYCNEAAMPPMCIKLQIKYSGEYIFYSRLNKRKNIFKNAKNKVIFPLGLFAYFILRIKYFLKQFILLQKINNKIKSKFRGKNYSKIIQSE